MRIDDAGSEIFSAGIDHGCRRRSIDGNAHGGDFAILDINAAVFQIAVGRGHDDGVFNYHITVRRGLLSDGSVGKASVRRHK